MVKESNYINIEGWMVTDIGLHGKELMAYAIIYGMSQDETSWYCGGRNYIADWLGCQPKTAGTVLSSLVAKGLLIREEVIIKNGKAHQYQAVNPRAKNALPLGRKTPEGEGEKRPTPRAKNAHINTMGDYNNENKERVGRFTPPTREEVAEYAREKGYTSFPVDRFIAHYESNGWMVGGKSKMKNWKASVTSWWLRDHQDEPKGTPMPQAFRDEIERGHQKMYEMLGYTKGLKKEGL